MFHQHCLTEGRDILITFYPLYIINYVDACVILVKFATRKNDMAFVKQQHGHTLVASCVPQWQAGIMFSLADMPRG